MSLTTRQLLIEVERMKLGLTAQATGGHLDGAEYQRLRRLFRTNPWLKSRVPRFVETCRTTDEFWSYIKPKFETYQERRDYLSGSFNPILDALELRDIEAAKLVDVDLELMSSDPLTHDYITEQIRKCRDKMDGDDYDGAITNARTLLEAVLRELEGRLSDETHKPDGELQRQYKRVTKLLNLDHKKKGLDGPFVEILRGFVSVVNGLAALRNTASDAHARSYSPDEHHARLAVNSSKTIVTFLFQTYEYQREKGLLVNEGGTTGEP